MNDQPILARRADYIRHRLQNRLTLRDDERDRLSHELQTYRSAIAGSQDRLKQLENRLTIARTLQNRQSGLPSQVMKSRRETEHAQTVRDLENEHAFEIEALQREFQETVAALSDPLNDKTTQRLAEIAAEIRKTHAEIDGVTKAIAVIRDAPEEDVDDSALSTERVESNIIARLQQRILAMNAGRGADLARAKEELSDSVLFLGEIEE
jgi:Skp family chaperone for outer membrane proteins